MRNVLLTFLPDNRRHAVEESLKLRIPAALIVDELHLDRFHWGDGQNGLAHASAKTGQQFTARGQLAVFVLHLRFECFECAEAAIGRKCGRDNAINHFPHIFGNNQWYSGLSNYRTADLGMLPYNSTDRPLYRPKKPLDLTVFFTQSEIPLYFLAPPSQRFGN